MAGPSIETALTQGPCPSFPRLASRYLAEYLAKIHHAASQLDEKQLWWRPAQGTNSVGNLLLHLSGNLTFWIGQGLGDVPYARDRAGEFSATGGLPKEVLLQDLARVVGDCERILEKEDEGSLSQTATLQGYETDRLGIIFHAVEHMAYHTGQILWAVKQALGDEHGIEFYPQHQNE